ncbi:MAG TPA: hydroxysqualene dehydroxylase HpnE [Pseudolabrys sp.]|nr:hydroxysqualene dehydroxylase HpnE [Pseudolabrys sp.]
MTQGTVHVIGAGLAGLSAAVRLTQAGTRVTVHEAGAQAGGRCRSYVDSVLDMPIDNGNHVILSGNRAALSYLETIGARGTMRGPASADFPFADLATRERWTLKLGDGLLPWWIFDGGRRVPNTRAADYLVFARLLWRPGRKAIGDVIACRGALYERLVEPFLLATLNNAPPEASAQLAATLLRETIAAGGRACRPLIAMQGLSTAFVDPALAWLKTRGADIKFGHELHRIGFAGGRATALEFGGDTVALGPGDRVVVAVPPNLAARLLPGLTVPTEFRAIANLHYKVDAPAMPVMTGVVHATTQWIFAYPGRLSVTISAADALMQQPREQLAREVWREVAQVAGLAETLPPWQVVRERRATIATDPAQQALRPPARTAWDNVVLAGDWTATGLPPTIESAIRSGERAAALAG